MVIRVTLEGFGDSQFRSFSIDPKTLVDDVCKMVAEKLKFSEIEVPEYGIFVVKNGLGMFVVLSYHFSLLTSV